MIDLFQLAYLAALALWLPLAVMAWLHPPVRRFAMWPLAASVIAAAYEAYMTFVWSPTVTAPIRVDILLVMFALGVIDAIAGFGLLSGARRRAEQKAMKLAASMCLAVPALAVAGSVAMLVDLRGVDRNLDEARRFLFEAFFRDAQTEKRAFGELTPVKNPWAGYYVGTGNDDRFAHLVINDEGTYWVYHQKFYQSKGHARPDTGTADTFAGVGDKRLNPDMSIELRRQEGDAFLLDVHYASMADSPANKSVPMRKTPPPRFPRPPSANDEVHFAGVFSATYGELNNSFWLSQVWLWESDGKWWGEYVRENFTHGNVREFISTDSISAACADNCKVLSFTSGRGVVTLTRVSENEFSAVMDGVAEPVLLKRGETLPGFFFDLAPVATAKEHHQWIKAVKTGRMITWEVP